MRDLTQVCKGLNSQTWVHIWCFTSNHHAYCIQLTLTCLYISIDVEWDSWRIGYVWMTCTFCMLRSCMCSILMVDDDFSLTSEFCMIPSFQEFHLTLSIYIIIFSRISKHSRSWQLKTAMALYVFLASFSRCGYILWMADELQWDKSPSVHIYAYNIVIVI